MTPLKSQTDSLFFKDYKLMVIDVYNLKNDLEKERQNLSDICSAYKKDTINLNKIIKDLGNKLSIEEQKAIELNKNKIIEERNNLQVKFDSLIIIISKQNKTLEELNKLLQTEKEKTRIAADKGQENGRNLTLSSIANLYKFQSFDEIIKSSTNESVARDMQIVGDNPELNSVLIDLQFFFSAKKLLFAKFDATQINTALTQLGQIKRQSKLLAALREDIESYRGFNAALKETISKIIQIDQSTLAADDSSIQKMKFQEIVTILTDYIYNNYDYTNYPYLSEIVIEIIKRKHSNADTNISDLLQKL